MKRMIGRSILALAIAASLGACASIPQRAWANGQAMTTSRGYRAVMSGHASMQAQRSLRTGADPLKALYRQRDYQPFTEWWW
jgi:starvation-inducible outer membrane lipoprotein